MPIDRFGKSQSRIHCNRIDPARKRMRFARSGLIARSGQLNGRSVPRTDTLGGQHRHIGAVQVLITDYLKQPEICVIIKW